MATKLYDKKGNEQFFPAKRVQGALKAGWSVTKPKKGKAKPPEPVAVDTPVDFMAGAEKDEEAIRQLAKEAGIGNYWNKSIDALKEELEL